MNDPSSRTQDDISFQSVIEALLDVEQTFPTRYLYRLSDLPMEEVKAIKEIWPKIPDWRRRGLIEDTETMFEQDYLLSYESLCRIGIRDEDPQIRFASLRSLAEYEVPGLVPEFIELMKQDPDADVREISTTLLGKYIYMGEIEELSRHRLEEIVEQLLLVYHSDDHPAIRQKALEALGYSSKDDIPKLIHKAYQSGDSEWKASAINAMGKSYNRQFTKIIIKELSSTHELIRIEAIRAAGELEISEASRILLENLEDANSDARMASVWSLSQIGGTGVRSSIEALLEEDVSEEEISLINEALEYLEFNESVDLDDLDDLDDYDLYD